MRKLDKIMDWTKPYSMIFSGVESEEYFTILYNMGIRDFLMSYEYLKSKTNLQPYREKGIKFFIDSGVYTYVTNPKYASVTEDEWEDQIVAYLKWAETNADIISAIANLDLDLLVGHETVTRWNREYFEPFMLRTGIPVCFIWHDIAGEENYEKYCQRYPYVGMTWISEKNEDRTLGWGVKKLKIAEKYNTLVHGMGMTRTSYLTKLPFYTTDSTTWLVGLQYGEVNYWTGTKMSRLKKEKWKGSHLNKLVDLGFDAEKLKNEDSEELIKVNVKAFQLACDYIDSKLRSRMYWLKARASENDLDDEDLFPSIAWVKGETNYDQVEMYAKRLNISTVEYDFARNCVIDATIFCHISVDEGEYVAEDPEYIHLLQKGYIESGMLREVYDSMINQVNHEEVSMVEELCEFYRNVVTGKEEKLLHWGTSFDRIAKERDKYIEEDEYETQDIDEEEMKEALKGLLTSPEDPAPEISELDDEIFKEKGIVPIRDENGRFVKGQKLVKRPKNLYSEKYPKLACDTCYAAQSCPEAKAGFVCAFHKMFKRFNTRDMGDIIEAMQSMVGLNLERMQRVAVFEMLDGGMPDGNLTMMIDQNMRLLTNLKQMYEYGSPEVLRKTTTVRADGSREETLQATNPQSGGILEKLFAMSEEKEKVEKLRKEDVEEDN